MQEGHYRILKVGHIFFFGKINSYPYYIKKILHIDIFLTSTRYKAETEECHAYSKVVELQLSKNSFFYKSSVSSKSAAAYQKAHDK